MTFSQPASSSNTTTGNNAQSYVDMASNAMRSPAALEASHIAKQNAQKIQQEVQQGDWSLHVLSLIAGIVMMIASVNGFLGKFVTLEWGSAILDVFVFCVGLGVVLVESRVVNSSLFASTNGMINNHAPFLRSIVGRGLLFVGTGIIEIFQRGLFDILIGCFVIYVGLSYLWMGHRAKQKLEAARKSALANEGGMAQLQEQFAMADTDGKGALTLPQFRQLIANLGLVLNKQESEAAFLQLDKSHSGGRLTYDAMASWWVTGQ